jgi:tetratricopeptide (TPR) repeat protein
MAKLSPNHPEYQRSIASNHVNLGVLYETSERWEEAEQCYQQALTKREALMRLQPDVPGREMRVVGVYFNLASLHKKLGRADKAEADYRKVAGATVLRRPADVSRLPSG